MAGILEIRRGSSGISLNDGEFYLNKGINAVQIGSGSSILTLLPLNKIITGDIILNGSITANNLTGSGAISSSLTTTLTVGGIPVGRTYAAKTDYNVLFSDLLAAYQKPVLSGLYIRYGNGNLSTNALEVGTPFNFNRIIVTSSIELPGTNYARLTTITASGATSPFTAALGNLPQNQNNISLGSVYTLQKNDVGNIKFTMNGVGLDDLSLEPIIVNIPYYFSNYLCASTTSSVNNNTTAQRIVDADVVISSLTGSKNWEFMCTDENNNTLKYTYIVYPSTYGDLSTILQGYLDVTTAFTKVRNTADSTYNFTINNTNSISSNYYIYRSNVPGAFASGSILTTK
jgi:hypothetical protein